MKPAALPTVVPDPPVYTVETFGYAFRVDGADAAAFARRLHELIDRAVDGECLSVPAGVTVRCIRAPRPLTSS